MISVISDTLVLLSYKTIRNFQVVEKCADYCLLPVDGERENSYRFLNSGLAVTQREKPGPWFGLGHQHLLQMLPSAERRGGGVRTYEKLRTSIFYVPTLRKGLKKISPAAGYVPTHTTLRNDLVSLRPP